MPNICVVCGGPVDWSFVKEEMDFILEAAYQNGAEAMDEQSKIVLAGLCCSLNCYSKLD